jgi:hypothetical protein
MSTPIKNNDNVTVKAAATTLPLLDANDRRQSSQNEQVLAEKKKEIYRQDSQTQEDETSTGRRETTNLSFGENR